MNSTESKTVYELAQQTNPRDPGAEVESIIGYLGHLTLTPDSVLTEDDVQLYLHAAEGGEDNA